MKIFPRVFELQSGQEIYFKTNQREITQKVTKVRKPGLTCLCATRVLVLFYISTKYHQNIPKGIQVKERTRSFTQTPTGSIPKTICSAILRREGVGERAGPGGSGGGGGGRGHNSPICYCSATYVSFYRCTDSSGFHPFGTPYVCNQITTKRIT